MTRREKLDMHRVVIGWASAFALLTTAQVAQAASLLIENFERYCLSADMSTADAEKRARSDGFVTPPAKILGEVPAQFRTATALWKVVDGGAVLLALVPEIQAPTRYAARLCAIGTTPAGKTDLSDFQSLMGFSPFSANGRDLYVFSEVNGARVRAPRPNMSPSELAQGKYVIAGGMTQAGDMTIYMIVRPTLSTPPLP